MTKRVAIFIATGSEPVEVIAPADVLRRGGVHVDIVSTGADTRVNLGHDVAIVADELEAQIDSTAYDMIVVPGGLPGVTNLEKSDVLAQALQHAIQDKFVASICAGPSLLAHLGLLEGYKATCYPGVEDDFPAGVYANARGVVIDRNLITASGPAFAMGFGLACLEVLEGEDVADKVASGLLMNAR